MTTESQLISNSELLEKILTVLERIEIVLEEKQNKTQDAKQCRELMQGICKYYKETKPSYNIQVGSRLTIYRFRDAISKFKNIRNTKYETRKLNRCNRKLEEFEFIARTNDVSFEVLDTGASWFD